MLDVNHITVGYNARGQFVPVAQDVSFHLGQGEIGCLLGESGCGKTTILRSIAGFEPLQNGSISLNGEIISSPSQVLPPEQRQVGMMFQDYALFPHLKVGENIGFGLRKLTRAQRQIRVDEMLELVGLKSYEDRYPHELSDRKSTRLNSSHSR